MDDDGSLLLFGLSFAGFQQNGDDGFDVFWNAGHGPRRVPQMSQVADEVVFHALQLHVRYDVVVAQFSRFQSHLIDNRLSDDVNECNGLELT